MDDSVLGSPCTCFVEDNARHRNTQDLVKVKTALDEDGFEFRVPDADTACGQEAGP